jgi:hypothetical protein
MPIRLNELDFLEAIFTWVDDDGSNTHIASSRLRKWVLENHDKVELCQVPVDHEIVKDYIANNAIIEGRVHALTVEELSEPIIFCKRHSWTDESQDVYLVDGHHRYVRHAWEGIPLINAWLLTVEQWEPFRVVDSVEITQDQLKRSGRMLFLGGVRGSK